MIAFGLWNTQLGNYHPEYNQLGYIDHLPPFSHSGTPPPPPLLCYYTMEWLKEKSIEMSEKWMKACTRKNRAVAIPSSDHSDHGRLVSEIKNSIRKDRATIDISMNAEEKKKSKQAVYTNANYYYAVECHAAVQRHFHPDDVAHCPQQVQRAAVSVFPPRKLHACSPAWCMYMQFDIYKIRRVFTCFLYGVY